MNVENKLQIAIKLFSEWKRSDVMYCHWKSNQHLSSALAGMTDLDILVNSEQVSLCEEALVHLKFKKVISPFWSRYPAIHDWIGFDFDTGLLCHVHLHYKLIIGRRYIKDIHLPVERWVMDARITQNGVDIPEHERELIIMIIRVITKVSVKKILLWSMMSKDDIFPENIRLELDWLISRCNDEKIPFLVKSSKINIDHHFFLEFISRYREGSFSTLYGIKTKIIIFDKLRKYRYGSMMYSLQRRFFYSVCGRTAKYLFGGIKKRLLSKGLYFAIVGSDGSGKSTLAIDLDNWLSWKIAVRRTYFGIPKLFIIRKSLIFLQKYNNKISTFIVSLLWLYLAVRRLIIHKINLRLARKGLIVISERFPIENFHSMPEPMDGPRISKAKSKIHEKLFHLERMIYKKIKPPDRVYILRASIDVLRGRRKDMDLNELKIKAQAVNSITTQKNYFFVNAERPYRDVLLELKREIWSRL